MNGHYYLRYFHLVQKIVFSKVFGSVKEARRARSKSQNQTEDRLAYCVIFFVFEQNRPNSNQKRERHTERERNETKRIK